MKVFDEYQELLLNLWDEDSSYSRQKKNIEKLRKASEKTTEKAFSNTQQKLLQTENIELKKAHADERTIINSANVFKKRIVKRVKDTRDCLQSNGLGHLLNSHPQKNVQIDNESASLRQLNLLVTKANWAADLVEKKINEYYELIAKEKRAEALRKKREEALRKRREEALKKKRAEALRKKRMEELRKRIAMMLEAEKIKLLPKVTKSKPKPKPERKCEQLLPPPKVEETKVPKIYYMPPAKTDKKELLSAFLLVVALMSALLLLLLFVHQFFPGFVSWCVIILTSYIIIHRLIMIIMIYKSYKSSKRKREMSKRGYVKPEKFKPYTPPEVRHIEKVGEKLRQRAKLK